MAGGLHVSPVPSALRSLQNQKWDDHTSCEWHHTPFLVGGAAPTGARAQKSFRMDSLFVDLDSVAFNCDSRRQCSCTGPDGRSFKKQFDRLVKLANQIAVAHECATGELWMNQMNRLVPPRKPP